MTLLVDSSVWIDYFNGEETPQTDYLDHALGNTEIVVGDLILAEVLQGFRKEEDFKTALNALLRFPIPDMVGSKLALKSARNFHTLRKMGVAIRKMIDCLIATFCIEMGIDLLHSDRDFNPFEEHLGLKVVRPAK